MTIQSALKEGYSILYFAEVETPMLDSTLLLAETLHFSREKLFASLLHPIDEETLSSFKKLIDKRCRGIPVSYIRRQKEFYGIEFYVDERVLVPRPDTETVIDTVLSLINDNPEYNTIHDVCTGSGCIAISLKYTNNDLSVSASDISPEAGEVFLHNSLQILDMELPFFCSNLLQSVTGCFHIITANPP